MIFVLYVGTVPTLCILNVGTVPALCILNVGTVPMFSPSELVHRYGLHYLSFWAGPPQWPQWRRRVTSLSFDLGHISNLNGTVKEALKSSIFVVQKADAPKTGVEFRQGSISTIKSSLDTLYDVWRRCVTSPTFDQSEAKKLSHTGDRRQKTTYWQALLYEQAPTKMPLRWNNAGAVRDCCSSKLFFMHLIFYTILFDGVCVKKNWYMLHDAWQYMIDA